MNDKYDKYIVLYQKLNVKIVTEEQLIVIFKMRDFVLVKVI
jgi:hypothetical protein